MATIKNKEHEKSKHNTSTQASRENSSASKSTQNSVTNKLWIQESSKLKDTKSSFYSDPRTSDSFMFVKNNKAPQLSERNPSRSIAGKTNLLADSVKNTDFTKFNPLSLRQQNIQSSTAQVITPNSKEYLNMLEQKTYETQPLYRSISDAVDQIVLGNYTDKVNLLGTLGQIVLGLTDFDIIGDVRDLTYDLTHINEVPWYQTALDIVGVLPVAGALKYSDETVDTVKGISKASKGIDALADTADSARTSLRVVNPMNTSFSGTAAAENASKIYNPKISPSTVQNSVVQPVQSLLDTTVDLGYNTDKSLGKIDLKPTQLMDELASSGVKYTPDNVLMIVKSKNSGLMCLETGNENSGFNHIMKHKNNFEKRGLDTNKIPYYLKDILENGISPDCVQLNDRGYLTLCTYQGKNYYIAYGTNGYIVSFFPAH